MADVETSKLLDDLRTFISSDSCDLSFLDDHSAASQELGCPMSDVQQKDNVLRTPAEPLPQVPNSTNHKRKRSVRFDVPLDVPHTASSRSRTIPVVVYDAKGDKRGETAVDSREVHLIDHEGCRNNHSSQANLARARTTLTMLPGMIAIIRYACNCRSPQGICNHHSFIGGLALPDGTICGRCSIGAPLQEIKTNRKCPQHRKDEFRQQRGRLRGLLYNEESIEMNVPSVPDLIQDFPATDEQKNICERHLRCVMMGTPSFLGPVIKSWSSEQRIYYARQRAHLEKFPNTFSGERMKW
ncbi:hypothetical protein GJ744_005740 [Endocarpon pusillum]|uniref:Uncharacterized protein n=1 Tax=Endocarpon pusillum TaxID=364733 RepID=A0A8H7E763_9EURO|nr:hypothetical protein GJ744_005740 [Endocarpon pusillum]